jgi:hypothetical protein
MKLEVLPLQESSLEYRTEMILMLLKHILERFIPMASVL